MKRKLVSILTGLLVLSLLAGCAGPIVVVEQPKSEAPAETPTESVSPAPEQTPEGNLKTGLAIVPGISKSVSATAEGNGKAEYDVTIVAVTVDDNGVIHSCVIDSIGATSEFTAEGTPAAAGTTEVKTKNELGFDYGMVAYNASAIGKEWFEQAAALAAFAEGKTMEQIKSGIAGGYASDVDLATSASIYLGGYVSGMEAAVANAKELGAEAGDELKLAVTASVEAAEGSAQLNVDAAALTVEGETITSCMIDSLQAKVEYDAAGTITTDVSAAPKTKNQLGFDYGMVAYKASGIGKEWFEQVENFCAYITGKTFAEVASIAVSETTAPADVDLAAGTTIAIGGFQKLIAKANEGGAATLKTGLAILPGVSKSVSATAEGNGKAEYDVTIVAVTVDDSGVIQSCVIDSIGATSEFTAEGAPAAAGTTEAKTKNELGFDYGMVAYNASAIGKEWFEQAAALAAFAEGKTMEQVKSGIAGGYASDVDLATSASIYLGGYVSGMEAAVANAKELGAEAGDELKLAVTASVDASEGAAQLNVDAAALTVEGETITSCMIDSLQAKVEYDAAGTITTDVSAAPKTKNQLGFDYGMVAYKASGIGKEWFEQVENFCAYITGKTFTEVAGIAVSETTAPADVDLAAGTTIAIGGFQNLIAKAAG